MRGVDELAVLLLDLADEDVADDVAVIVEVDRPARRVGEATARSALISASLSSDCRRSFLSPASITMPLI